MPPKKQEQAQITQYKPCFVLPLFMNGQESVSARALHKPVNIKKNIDSQKIIQILKDKGIQQHVANNVINQEGRKIACQNIKYICDQYVSLVNKPVDIKKDAKKDAKKQAKKQQVVENVSPAIEIQFQKNCNDFFLFLSVPSNAEQLQIALSKDVKIDILIIVKQKIKPGSRKPNYDLLNKQKSLNQIAESMNSTIVEAQNNIKNNQVKQSNSKNINQMMQVIKKYRMQLKEGNANKNLIILQTTYLNDLQKPEQNQLNFIKSFFAKVCKSTKNLQQYSKWKATRQLVPMIPPIKQTISKQVLVQQKNDKGKKGGKSSDPVYQTVNETIYKRYEDFAQNVKSDLKCYKTVKKINEDFSKNVSNQNNTGYIFKTILHNCVKSLKANKNITKQQNQNMLKIAREVAQKFNGLAVHQSTAQSISKKIRSVNYYKSTQMDNSINFQFQKADGKFSYMQLSQKAESVNDKLFIQFLMFKAQQIAKKNSPKLQWNFKDRTHIQRLTKQQINSLINEQVLYDPQIFTGQLKTEGLNVIITSKTNPPGRVLYQNSIFQMKVLPDFQNWVDKFINTKQQLQKQQFLDYEFEETGNLAIKTKIMMPADNSIIKDSIFSIGSKNQNIIQLQKDDSRFGLSKKTNVQKQKFFVYWHDINKQWRLRAFKFCRIEQNNQQSQQNHQRLDVVIQKNEQYTIHMNPYPTIFWTNSSRQRCRSFDCYGSITSYRIDGSIHIYRPNGQVSIFSHGKWQRTPNIQNNQQIFVKQFSEGQSNIKIRQNQTIILIDAKKNRKLIFPDGTQIIENLNLKKRQIKNPNGPYIRVYIGRDFNLNQIGYGSAFAYLGFRNILQRSYDGYLFQLIDHDFTSHFYTEKFQRNGKLQSQQIRIITHKNGSVFKLVSEQSKIVFVSPKKKQVLTDQALNQRWLQTFTTKSNQGEGVFQTNLNFGQIQTKDSETNKFIAKIDDRSQAQIAISFITEDDDNQITNFPNGFHIKQQNYFLPPPSNRIPSRIFVIKKDGSGFQVLNKDQIVQMKDYKVTNQHQNDTQITQYCLQRKPDNSFKNLTFSQPMNQQAFGLPDALKATQSRQILTPSFYQNVKHRVLENINWDHNFSNINRLTQQLQQQLKQKYKRKQQRLISQKQHGQDQYAQ